MKQLIIDISEQPTNMAGLSAIVFHKTNTWTSACQLVIGSDHYESDFGCCLTSLSGKDGLTIETVEHGRQIIAAIELAIENGWLFTKAEVAMSTRVTDTRADLRKKVGR